MSNKVKQMTMVEEKLINYFFHDYSLIALIENNQ